MMSEKKGISNYSDTSKNSESRNCDRESEIVKSKIRDYIEVFLSTLPKQNDIQSPNSIPACSSKGYRVKSGISNRDALFDNDICMLESFETNENGKFLNRINIPTPSTITGSCSISSDQVGILENDVEPRNCTLLEAQSSDSRRGNFWNSRKLLIPANNILLISSHRGRKTKVESHPDDRRFSCNTCGKSFHLLHHLVSHFRNHINKKPFSCHKCKKKFSKLRNLDAHHRTRIDVFKSTLPKHNLPLLEVFKSTLPKQNDIQSPNSIPACSRKGYRLKSDISNRDALFDNDACVPKSFANTENGTFSNRINIPTSSDITGSCNISIDQTNENLQGILGNDVEPRNRTLLGAQSSDSRTSNFWNSRKLLVPANNILVISSHRSTKTKVKSHPDDRRFSCNTCVKSFHLLHHLVSHFRNHINKKPFSHYKSKKKFNKSGNLSAHRRTHTEEKPFTCEKCGTRFSQKIYLDCHLRTHTDKKPFVCDNCGKRFRLKHYLNIHTGRIMQGRSRLLTNKCDKTLS